MDIHKTIREVLSIICVLGLNINGEPKENKQEKFSNDTNYIFDELPWLTSLSDLKNSVTYNLDRKCLELFFLQFGGHYMYGCIFRVYPKFCYAQH